MFLISEYYFNISIFKNFIVFQSIEITLYIKYIFYNNESFIVYARITIYIYDNND